MNAEELPTPTPRINLSSGEDVRREMARVYREARAGTLGTNEASKLFYMLGHILKAHEVIVLENRLIRLESNMNK
jgi:hypothetical protein